MKTGEPPGATGPQAEREKSRWRRVCVRVVAFKAYAVLILYLLFLSTEPRSLDDAFLFLEEGQTHSEKAKEVVGGFDERLAPYDGQWYLDIGHKGYRRLTRPEQLDGVLPEGNYAFFPLLAGIVRVASTFCGTFTLGASLAFLFVLSCCGYMAVLTLSERVRSPSELTLLLMLAFPAAVFQYTLYTEGLFIFVSGFAILSAFRGHGMAAAIFGIAGGLCRPQGVLLCLPIWIELRRRQGSAAACFAAAAPLSGFAAMALISWHVSGSPLGFVSIQGTWGRSHEMLNIVTSLGDFFSYSGPSADLLGVVLGVGLLVPMWRRLPRSLAAFGTGMVVMPLLTGSLLSFGRFFSVSIPHFLVLAILLESKTFLRRGVLCLFVLWQTLLAKGLVGWYFVG